MPQGNRKSALIWLALRCPSCKIGLRIKVAYAHLRGRCPECGYRIEAPRPRSIDPRPVSASEEPLGLVPDEEEWPEPAQLDGAEGVRDYGLAPAMEDRRQPPADPTPQPTRGIPHAREDPPRRAPVAALPGAPRPSAPYEFADQALPPRPETSIADLLRPDDLEHRPPPPPGPLWRDLLLFPWLRPNLAVTLFLTMDFTLLAGLTAMGVVLLGIGGYAALFVPPIIAGLAMIGLWIGSYAADNFLAAVEDTAGGNDEVAWPRGNSVLESMGRLLFLVWVGINASVVASALFLVGYYFLPGGNWWVSVAMGMWALVFAIMLLSTLAAGSPWILIERGVVGQFMKKPGAFFLAVVPGWLLLQLCVVLLVFLLIQPRWWMIPVVGGVWGVTPMLYGRFLGRSGWIMVRGGQRRIRRFKERIGLPRTEPLPTEKPEASTAEVDKGWG